MPQKERILVMALLGVAVFLVFHQSAYTLLQGILYPLTGQEHGGFFWLHSTVNCTRSHLLVTVTNPDPIPLRKQDFFFAQAGNTTITSSIPSITIPPRETVTFAIPCPPLVESNESVCEAGKYGFTLVSKNHLQRASVDCSRSSTG